MNIEELLNGKYTRRGRRIRMYKRSVDYDAQMSLVISLWKARLL